MENKHQVHNLIILDESGSMEPIKTTIIQGFNELVQTIQGIEKQFPEQEHFISFVSFNGLGQKLLHFIDPASKLKHIDDKTYKPGASTPLFDAMGFSINKLKQSLQEQSDYNVLVTILTDGEENASKEFSGNDYIMVSSLLFLCPSEKSDFYCKETEDIIHDLVKKHQLERNSLDPHVGMLCKDNNFVNPYQTILHLQIHPYYSNIDI